MSLNDLASCFNYSSLYLLLRLMWKPAFIGPPFIPVFLANLLSLSILFLTYSNKFSWFSLDSSFSFSYSSFISSHSEICYSTTSSSVYFTTCGAGVLFADESPPEFSNKSALILCKFDSFWRELVIKSSPSLSESIDSNPLINKLL